MVAPPLLTPTNETWREEDLMTWHGAELVIAIFLLVAGIFGNTLVLHVYTFRLPGSTVTLIKSALALLDLSAVVVTKTFLLYMLLNPSSHFYDSICVLAANFSFWNTGCADLVLVLIAVDRYMRICTKNKRVGVNARLAKKLFVTILVFCAVLDLPIFWLFGKTVKYVPEYGVRVTHCFFRPDKLKSTLFYIYFFMLLIFFLVTSSTLFILYFKIIRRLQNHYSVHDRLKSSTLVLQPEIKRRSSMRDAMKNSIVAFAIITVCYIISSFVFMVTLCFYAVGGGMDPAMTPQMQLIHDLAKQSFMYTRIINPIVYSFTSSEFRREACRVLLCKVCTSWLMSS